MYHAITNTTTRYHAIPWNDCSNSSGHLKRIISSFSFSLFFLFFLGLNRCSDNCCDEKKQREKSKDEATILQLAGLDQHQGGRGDQVERNLGGQDDDDGDDDEAHPKQVDDCRSVRAGKIKAAIEQFQLGFNYS